MKQGDKRSKILAKESHSYTTETEEGELPAQDDGLKDFNQASQGMLKNDREFSRGEKKRYKKTQDVVNRERRWEDEDKTRTT